MILATAKTVDLFGRLEKAKDKAAYRNFGHAAASIRKDIVSTIVDSPGPSIEGEPPHTHRRKFLRRAIRFAYTREDAIIGTMYSVVGTSGEAHEKGITYKGESYPERPFVFPALERGESRFAGSWRGSIGK